jgi:hypothetical protein
MKPNELQIGDYAIVNKDVCIKKGTIVKVWRIDATYEFPEMGLKGVAGCMDINNRSQSGGVWLDYLSPIPLTDEILTANGFERKKEYAKYEWSEGYVEIWVILDDTGEGRNVIHIEDERRGIPIHYHNTITFVHELQHALRLCGIEKEIKL